MKTLTSTYQNRTNWNPFILRFIKGFFAVEARVCPPCIVIKGPHFFAILIIKVWDRNGRPVMVFEDRSLHRHHILIIF